MWHVHQQEHAKLIKKRTEARGVDIRLIVNLKDRRIITWASLAIGIH